MTGWPRDYARAGPRDAPKPKILKPRQGSAATYGPLHCWAPSGASSDGHGGAYSSDHTQTTESIRPSEAMARLRGSSPTDNLDQCAAAVVDRDAVPVLLFRARIRPMPEAAAGLDEMGPLMMRTTGNPRWSEGGPAGPARRDQPGGTRVRSRRRPVQVPPP